ncbi:MAG: M23 family metallopeptidase [Alphaproteobacteria bacterium]|nr:M23 family metallopeptidase [Alphaproteobacteria bacterium]
MSRAILIFVAATASCSLQQGPKRVASTGTDTNGLSPLVVDNLPVPRRLPFSEGDTAYIAQSIGGTFSHKSPIQYSIDFARDEGTAVLAVARGTVTHVHSDCKAWDSGCNHGVGNEVVISHGRGVYSAYYHLDGDSIRVSEEDEICIGYWIGDVGTTGFIDGTHIHFQFQTTDRNIYESGGSTIDFDSFDETSDLLKGSTVKSQNVPTDDCTTPGWWCECITNLKELGLLERDCSGYSPLDTLDRAGWTKVIGTAIHIDELATFRHCPNVFDDVPDDAWYEPFSSSLSHLDHGDTITVLAQTTLLQPAKAATRCEAVKMIAEAWDLPPSTSALPFSDTTDVPDWCVDPLQRSAAAGIVATRTGRFRPNNYSTVGEAACMIDNALRKVGSPRPTEADFLPECRSNTCSDECSTPNDTKCSNGTEQSCNDHDLDGCLEWGGAKACGALGCGAKTCVTCAVNHHQDCYNGHPYWFDSCNVRGVQIDTCIANETCVDAGATATCQSTCTANHHQDCYNGHPYWFDSCNVRGVQVDTCIANARTCVGCRRHRDLPVHLHREPPPRLLQRPPLLVRLLQRPRRPGRHLHRQRDLRRCRRHRDLPVHLHREPPPRLLQRPPLLVRLLQRPRRPGRHLHRQRDLRRCRRHRDLPVHLHREPPPRLLQWPPLLVRLLQRPRQRSRELRHR